jgi:hypothetical protein
MSESSYYNKYLKYKSKYFRLINLVNLLGGGKQSAMDTFLARFDDNVKTIVINDRNNRFLDFDGDPSKENVPLLTNIFEQIYTYVNKDNKNIDWIIKSYINNTFGRPSSLENFGRFTKALAEHKLLTTNIDGIKPIANINGLLELEKFVRSSENLDYLRCIDIKKIKQQKRDERNRTDGPIRAAGINDKEVILETDKIIIYMPTSEAGSKSYGQGTTWCTTAAVNCQFDYYNGLGKLYIIQSKSNSKLKFQLHVEKDQLMNPTDDPVTIDFVKETFSDEKLNKWLDGIWEKTMIDNYTKTQKLVINDSIFNIVDSNKFKALFSKLSELISLTWNCNRCQIDDSLIYLPNLKELTWNSSAPVSNLSTYLPNLQKLIWNSSAPLSNLLTYLPNLKEIRFGNKFNNDDQQLGDSLKRLTNLENIYYLTDKPIGNLLYGLTNLQIFGYENFTSPFGDSLKDLTNLKSLQFGPYFNLPLDDSLKSLTNLKWLGFGSEFDQPLGNSLNGLDKLERLDFGLFFNQPLNDSLKNLTNLKSLFFGNEFNNGDKPLGDSLKNLSNLEKLYLPYKFNQPLEDSLKYLPNLKMLNGKPYP